MKVFKIVSAFFAAAFLFISVSSFSQNPVNWTKGQLMEPFQLAFLLQNKQPLPLIISVGPGAVIPGSISIGPVQDKSNLDKLQQQLSTINRDSSIVIYCGCCPFEHCPNVRPAVALLKEMKFTHYKLLNLEHNAKTDWLDKGYPAAKL